MSEVENNNIELCANFLKQVLILAYKGVWAAHHAILPASRNHLV
jgi:hypothetical protein